jgi:hypothetical protein
MGYALLTLDHIYIYLLEQYSVPYADFTKLFDALIGRGYILSLFEKDKCSKSSEENFSTFGYGNMQNAIKLISKDYEFCKTFYNKCEKETYTVKLFFLIANLYTRLNDKEWMIAKSLLKNLPDEYTKRVLFMGRLEAIGYFRNIIQSNDYRSMVKDEKTLKEYLKYIYILTTSYPRKNDEHNLFTYAMDTNILDKDLQSGLNHMMQMDKEALEKHKFTGVEVYESIFNKVEYASYTVDVAIMITSSVTAIQSGGASVAAGAEALAVKKTFIYTAKKFFKKILLKNSKSHITSSTVSTVKGYALKKFSKSSTKEGVKTVVKALDDAVMLGDVESIRSDIYLYLNSTNIEVKTICEEEK